MIDTPYISAAMRSPIGKRHGALAALDAAALTAEVVRGVLAACDITAVDRVLLANTTNAGNIARNAALGAGLAASTPATTVNNQCAGGLTAIRLGAEAIAGGHASLVLAGGADSVTHTIVALEDAPPRRGIAALPRVRHTPDGWPDPGMGPSADALAAHLAIDRAAQDAYAAESYRRTSAAREEFVRGIVAVSSTTEDQLAARAVPSLDRLARYPSAFHPGGTVTAGNCAAAADGAAIALLGSRAALDAAAVAPRARVVTSAPAASDPALPALAVIPAIERALVNAHLDASDIDLWEVNEAFAVKVIAVMRHFNLDHARVNVLGGAIALGHPFAASGAILLVHTLAALEAHGAQRGLLALAGAGGVAEAMIIERLEVTP